LHFDTDLHFNNIGKIIKNQISKPSVNVNSCLWAVQKTRSWGNAELDMN